MAATITYPQILTRGISSQLPAVSDGKLRFTTDTRCLYLDNGNTRIQISDVITGNTEAQILDIIAALPKLYLASDTFNLWYKSGATWEKISKATELSGDIDVSTADIDFGNLDDDSSSDDN